MSEENTNILLRKVKDVYCQNCYRSSHCDNILTLALYPDGLPSGEKPEVCKYCRCDTCKSNIYKREHISKFYTGDGVYIHCPKGRPDRIEDDGTLTYFKK